MAVTNLRLDPQRRSRRLAGDEVHRLGQQTVAIQIGRVPYPDRVAPGVEVDDVERTTAREAEAAALADGIGRDPGVRPDHAPPAIDDCSRLEQPGRAAAQESTVVVVGYEADLLTLGLVGGDQAQAARGRSHLVLRQGPDRKPRRGQLRLTERPQKIGLVLSRVGGAEKQMAARRGIARDARVVAGRDGGGVPRPGAPEERTEL